MHNGNQANGGILCFLQLASGMQGDMLQMIQAQPGLLLHGPSAEDVGHQVSAMPCITSSCASFGILLTLWLYP